MDPRSLFFFAILILLSMFFSGSETAFISLPMHKVNAFKKEKKNGATALYRLKHHSERMLIMILIGNNIVNIAAASLATLISLQIATTIGYHQNLIVTLSTILVTILILLFGEIFPKTFANQHTEKISLFIAPIYVFLIKIFHPIILVIQWMMQGLSKKGDKKVSISESDFEAIKYIEDPSESVQLIAVQENWKAIEYIENPTEEVQLAAVQEDWEAIEYIKNPSYKVYKLAEQKKKESIG